jgi:hypothetical protein
VKARTNQQLFATLHEDCLPGKNGVKFKALAYTARHARRGKTCKK